MELRLKSCILRPWQRGDEESLVLHAHNIKIWRNLRDGFPHPYTMEAARLWIDSASSDSAKLNFAIVVGGAAVGGISLIFQPDIHRHSAEMGYWLGDEFWGRGIMTEAVNALRKYAFEHLDLNRIFARVFETNLASKRILEKAGFVFEGRLRNHVVKEGKIMDELLYSTLRSSSDDELK